jgi:hypothetical protein
VGVAVDAVEAVVEVGVVEAMEMKWTDLRSHEPWSSPLAFSRKEMNRRSTVVFSPVGLLL